MATAIANFPAAGSDPAGVAAVNVTLPSGAQQLSFFLQFATWSPASSTLAVIWLEWATDGVYPFKNTVLPNFSIQQRFLVIVAQGLCFSFIHLFI
jgi:hypothetical protein